MILKTTNGVRHKIKWLEYWNENGRFFLAEDVNGELLKFESNELDKIEEE